MSENFTVEIISPDNSIIETEASEVVIPSYEGEMGILKNHVPLITFLRPGLIKINNDAGEIFYVEDGTVEFSDNKLLVLTSTAKKLKEIKSNLVSKLIVETEEKLKNEISDKEKYLLSYKIETLKNISQ